MTLTWIAALAVWAAASPAPAARPAGAIAALVRFQAPAGWTRSDDANSAGADPVVSFERGADRIAVYAYGAPGSAYRTPADFLKGPAATTMGRPPVRAGSAVVAGRKTPLYRREIPLIDSDPHESTGRPPRMGVEIFCVLAPAADGRFLVLARSRSTPVPDLEARGDKDWKVFLKTVRPAGPKP
jgi:hypothetical protein